MGVLSVNLWSLSFYLDFGHSLPTQEAIMLFTYDIFSCGRVEIEGINVKLGVWSESLQENDITSVCVEIK